ncbi:MAG: glycosyltransferase, partial [Lachnospiraceae bacterium]|nr:glycosyltransferase [Lachnospiraceae bacterium]
MAPLVSIIVPVYNIKKYLRRCADSLLGQDYENLEILFIDDGSTDGSESILDEYQRQDPRVRVIHQANAGVSASRNRGLDLARSEYIQFADSDDWLPADAMRQLVNAAQEQ